MVKDASGVPIGQQRVGIPKVRSLNKCYSVRTYFAMFDFISFIIFGTTCGLLLNIKENLCPKKEVEFDIGSWKKGMKIGCF